MQYDLAQIKAYLKIFQMKLNVKLTNMMLIKNKANIFKF